VQVFLTHLAADRLVAASTPKPGVGGVVVHVSKGAGAGNWSLWEGFDRDAARQRVPVGVEPGEVQRLLTACRRNSGCSAVCFTGTGDAVDEGCGCGFTP